MTRADSRRRALRSLDQAGEQVLLPAVRGASPHTLLLTDGFSCRSQISQCTDRGALHLSQVVQMALRDGPNGPAAARPEQLYCGWPVGTKDGRNQLPLAAGTVAAVCGGLALSRIRKAGSAR